MHICASENFVTPFPWTDLLIIAGLIVLNGVFAMSELAIVSAQNRAAARQRSNGNRAAQIALQLAAEPGKFLSTVQIGITLIAIIAGCLFRSEPRRRPWANGSLLGVPASWAVRPASPQ